MFRDEIMLMQSGFVEIPNFRARFDFSRYSHTKLPILINKWANGYTTMYLFQNGCISTINELTTNVRQAIRDGMVFARQPKSKIQIIGRLIQQKIEAEEQKQHETMSDNTEI